jgi:very-short-patch-repair endonuclease
MSAPWKKYIPKKATRKRRPSNRFKVRFKAHTRTEPSQRPDYIAAFEACHGDKQAMARFLYKHRTHGERTLAHFLRYLHIEHQEQHVLYGWIVDFFLPRLNCVVEVDGSFHLIPKRAAEDRHRDAVLRSKGLRVLHYDNFDCDTRPSWVVVDILTRLKAPPPDFSTLAAAARPTRSVSRTPETQAAVTPRMEIPHAEKLPGETGS